MGRRLILDTNILIAYERGTIDRTTLDEDAELTVASVSIAEYRVGIELADTPERAAERARALAAIMSVIDVLDYTETTAAHHGRLLAHVRKSRHSARGSRPHHRRATPPKRDGHDSDTRRQSPIRRPTRNQRYRRVIPC